MCTGRHYVALMWHSQVALMSTDRWHCWGYTDHQGTLIISALMISCDSS
ncbi:unnamed protein product [Staurois parvus]|uniref:Uncharacterized protein n=1 Tax=Staurois parvus TaxID=386267 RepID=A0ABN9CKQ9_9NEOB|nr:unnamed protein product [Staurois parvus]